jgi:sterol desaturase/sphingolipid hydroxylase (fatty acid hydroxylase superfamily)
MTQLVQPIDRDRFYAKGHKFRMIATDWPAQIEWLTSGQSGFLVYWAVLIGVALLELWLPGAKPLQPLGPRLKVNLMFGLIAAVLFSIPFLSTLALAQLVTQRGWGLIGMFDWPLWQRVLVSFVAMDLAGYAIHRLSHSLPVLWRMHRVHHSDNDIDLSTLFRAHPAAVIVTTLLEFVVIAALGLHPLGIMASGLAKLATMALGHANVASHPRLSRVCGAIFVTPNFHRMHHSASLAETDSNYGEVLTVWDRLFGSVSRSTGPIERFGLGDAFDHDAAAPLGQLKLPFVSR